MIVNDKGRYTTTTEPVYQNGDRYNNYNYSKTAANNQYANNYSGDYTSNYGAYPGYDDRYYQNYYEDDMYGYYSHGNRQKVRHSADANTLLFSIAVLSVGIEIINLILFIVLYMQL